MSALARLCQKQGARVSGSDIARSEITDALKHTGIRVIVGKHRKSNVGRATTKVIYSAAIPATNPELREAKRRRIPIESYAEAIGKLTRTYKTIAVAGAHGKSTTTALTALMLRAGGLDPTVIIGTKLREFGDTNFRHGRSNYLVLEADEYRGSFLHYHPASAVVTNIDREHLDFYKNIAHIEHAFLQFLRTIKQGGRAVLNRDDARVKRIAEKLKRQRKDIAVSWFSLRDREATQVKKALRIPGTHNVANALAAYRVARALGVSHQSIVQALHAYTGAWRRFEYQGMLHGAKVFADYAHHPTEIKATLQGAREKFPTSKIWCVFQPHHYERTRDLFREFTTAFDHCDELILLDIYEVAGRERKHAASAVSSEKLAAAIARCGVRAQYLASNQLKTFLRTHLKNGDVIIMMGAGSIWEMTKNLLRNTVRTRAN